MTLATLPIPQLPKSTEVRSQLIDALELDLIGPTQRVLQALGDEGTDLIEEKLKSSPSNPPHISNITSQIHCAWSS